MPRLDRYGRPENHPDFDTCPNLDGILLAAKADVDWRLAGDTLTHVFVSAAKHVHYPKVRQLQLRRHFDFRP